MTIRPDPTFHATAKLAMEAPPEKYAYTLMLSPRFLTARWARLSSNVDPNSSEYGKIVHTVMMPNKGDEFHHFGWNACSSALSPLSGHAFLERRYLIIPGLRSSRIYVIDTKPDPTQAKIYKIIEPEEVFRKTGYSRPHTIHCGPEGIYVSTLGGGGPNGTEGPPGIFVMDCETFDVLGRWEMDRGPQDKHYDFWWNLPRDYMVSSEWALPPQFEKGIVPEDLLGNKYGHRLHFWDLRARRNVQTIDLGAEPSDGSGSPASPRPDQGIRLCRRCSGHYQPRGVDLDVVARGRQISLREDCGHSPRTGGEGKASTVASGVRRRAAADHRHRPLARRPVPVCILLGHRRDAPGPT